MKEKILFLNLVAVCSCGPGYETNEKFIEQFNSNAATSFVADYRAELFEPMTNFDKCILHQNIERKLDALNKSKLTVIDSFYVRNYYLPDLHIEFSFVANRQHEFNLIYLPQLWEYHNTDKYYDFDQKRGMFKLKDSSNFSIARIDSRLFDDFFHQQVFTGKTAPDGYKLSEKLIEEILPLLDCEISEEQFFESIYRKPSDHANYIFNTLTPLMKSEVSPNPSTFNYKFYSCEFVGMFFLHYYFLRQKIKIWL